MIDIQGVPADVGGYYKLDEDKANAVMRPSKVTLWFLTLSVATIFNLILQKFNELMDNY